MRYRTKTTQNCLKTATKPRVKMPPQE